MIKCLINCYPSKGKNSSAKKFSIVWYKKKNSRNFTLFYYFVLFWFLLFTIHIKKLKLSLLKFKVFTISMSILWLNTCYLLLFCCNNSFLISLFQILLNMTSTHGQSLTTNSVITLITRCFDSYCNGSAAVKTAAQATVNQTLTSFCIMLHETSGGHEVSLVNSNS